jgi:hypothetical protein
MEKKTRTADAGKVAGIDGGGSVVRLPDALLVEVLRLLEVDDACSAAASCRALHTAAAVAISAITTLDLSVSFSLSSVAFHTAASSPSPVETVFLNAGLGRPLLQEFAPSNAILSRILAGNGSVRSLAINCSRLDDSSAAVIAKHSLCELSLLKCSFSMSFFVAIGERCPNLRYVSSPLSYLCPIANAFSPEYGIHELYSTIVDSSGVNFRVLCPLTLSFQDIVIEHHVCFLGRVT